MEAFETPIEGYECLVGGGEMGSLMRSYDWSKTLLGPVAQWPQSLRSALSICLNSRFPIAIYWGTECLLLYNDAWRPIVGDKHPWSVGRPGREVWPEIWSEIGPEFEKVFSTGEGIFHSDELLAMHRFGYTEECFFDYTFNPIQGEAGGVEGIFNVVSETTYRVLNDRRARLLREVASKTGIAKTVEEACALMTAALKSDPADIPFSLLYLIDSDGKQAHLYSDSEFAQDNPIAPAVIDLDAEDGRDSWLIRLVAQTAQSQVIDDLVPRFGTLPGSPWPEPPQEALVLPIVPSGQTKVVGVLAAVTNPRRRLDSHYLDFLKQVTGQIAVAITNARSYEAERQRAEQLAELDRAKTVFFSNVSHEFRTPLTLMLGPAEDALRETQDPEQRDRLELIHRNALRLQKLVNTLLDFSRIEAGRLEAIYEPTDLAMLTTGLAGVFRSAIEQAGLCFQVDCPSLPEPVYVDRDMWEKIVLNLLSNALKFTFEGEIVVTLRVCGDWIELGVRDTGTGIPADELPHVFERFHRVKGAKGRSYEGSGIGLSLVQELVKLQGGTIQVNSVVNQGTCFTVSLPRGAAHLPRERISASRPLSSTATGVAPYVEEALRWQPPARAELEERHQKLIVRSPTPANTQPTSSVRILLADDNADMRDYLQRLLSQQYEVEVVGDGVAALATIRQQMPALLLTDVMMPEMDGFELLRSLRSDPVTQDLPIILLSARSGEEARIEGLEAGADDYLTKPFSTRELLARVEATLKLAQLRQEAAQKEQALRVEVQAAKSSLEKVLARIADQFLALDCEWRYTYVNDQVTEVTGISRENLLGKSIWEIFPDLVGTEFYTQIHGAVAEQTSVQFEYFYPLWNRWFENHVYPSADGVSVIVTEITDRKHAEAALRESEARFRQMTDAAPMLVWMSGTDKLCNYFNQSWLTFTGRTMEQELGNGWTEGIHPDDFQRCMDTYTTAFDSHQSFEIDYRLRRFDGQYRWILDVGIPRFTPDGEFLGYIGSCFDIHDRKQAETEREQLLDREHSAREAAEAANRIKDEFLAVLSHELRSPLNPILGWSKLLQMGKLDEAKTKQALATIERNAKLQAELIEDLLDVSRILQGKLSLTVSLINLASVIEAAIEIVRLAAEAKDIQIETRLNPEVARILGDSTRLQQVVWNLLANAVKFTPSGGRVEVRLEQVDHQAQITVSDTGKGISSQFLPYVFDYFRQADSATTRQFGGLGLGLAIVRHLVELHGGTVAVTSSGEGQGSTFTVRLPLPQQAQFIESEPFPTTQSLLPLANVRVLVVDDEADSRELITFVLEQAGAIVTSAASAIAALEAFTQSHVDVLVSDIGMPEIDGYRLIQQIRAMQPKFEGNGLTNSYIHPIGIALTAYAGDIDQQQAIAAGFQSHVAKPIEPELLVQAIVSLLAKSPIADNKQPHK